MSRVDDLPREKITHISCSADNQYLHADGTGDASGHRPAPCSFLNLLSKYFCIDHYSQFYAEIDKAKMTKSLMKLRTVSYKKCIRNSHDIVRLGKNYGMIVSGEEIQHVIRRALMICLRYFQRITPTKITVGIS